MLTKDVLSQLYKMAAASPHKEICGVLTQDLEVIPIRNIARVNHHFILHRGDWFRLLNRLKEERRPVLAVYHSHIDGDTTPSEADIQASKRTGYDYLIITAGGKYRWVEV